MKQKNFLEIQILKTIMCHYISQGNGNGETDNSKFGWLNATNIYFSLIFQSTVGLARAGRCDVCARYNHSGNHGLLPRELTLL